MGGTCSISPLKRCSTAARDASCTGRFSSTSPSASPVEVRSPSLSVARYSLSASSSGPANLVASPNSTSSRPEASGSSVPAWPALAAPQAFFALCSAALELRPSGLSSSSAPSITLLGAFDEPGKVVAALHRFVVLEAQLRCGVHLDAPGELRAQEAGRTAQAGQGLLQLVLLQHREEDLGVRHVGGDVDRGDGDHADPGIAHLQPDQLRDFPLDEVAQSLRATLPGLHNVLATSVIS